MRLAALALATVLALGGRGASSGEAAELRRFLVIYGQNSVQPVNLEFAAGIDRALSRLPALDLEVYTTFLDHERFPEAIHKKRIAEDLAARFAERPLDVVVTIGPDALEFALARREWFAPGVPLVFGAMTAESLSRLDLPPDAYGTVSAFDVERTLRFALQLQPDAPRIVVIAGSSNFDRRWAERARAALGDSFGGVPVEHLSDLSLERLEKTVRNIESDAIVIVLTIYRDATGKRFVPIDALRVLTAASAAPVYSVYSLAIGAGALGGDIVTFADIGEATAALAISVAEGDGAAPRLVETSSTPTVDWRQIVRHGINPAHLPEATVRMFYSPTAWEQYRLEILGAAAIILFQSGTIAALLQQARRRRKLARELASGRRELAHASRAAQLGELSGALAHELNQPLASILANAEAGSRLLRTDRPDLAEVADILTDIAEDDRRAADIIAELRRLLVKGDAGFERLDLDALVEKTLVLVRGELRVRGTRAEFQPGAAPVVVHANRAQIQQVVLNLVLNAAEAMADLAPETRRIAIATAIRTDGCRELRVADSGPGVTPEQATIAFRPFVTTKEDGLGLGLSICRSIAEAHRGSLDFDHESDTGAVAVLTLPPPP